MEYWDFMSRDLTVTLKSELKNEAIIEMAELAGAKGIVEDVEDLTEKLLYREQLMSTGLGLGIGIPHVRYAGLKKPAILVGIQPSGISDYESIDNQLVKIVIMILLKEGDHKRHVRLLSQIVPLLKDQQALESLVNTNDPDKVYDFFRQSVNK